MGEKKKQPKTIRLGAIVAEVWKNQKPDGEVWFNVTLNRSFQVNGDWREANSFRRDDLPIAAKALDMAYTWIWTQNIENKQRKTPTLPKDESRRSV